MDCWTQFRHVSGAGFWELRSAGICWGTNRDNTFVCVALSLFFYFTAFPRGASELKPQLFLSHSHIHLAQTRARQFGFSYHLYSGWSVNGFSDSDLFFCVCADGLCLHCEDLGKEREREEGGKKKTSLTEAQSIISQVFD